MKVADFFCGGGGFSEGFRQAGFEVVFAVDKWDPAVLTHKGNHPNCRTINKDIVELSFLPDDEFNSIIPDTEVIIGSPPCVAFSSSNKSGKGDKAEGIKLFEAYLRIIARKKKKKNSILKYWILENVPNIQKYIKDEYTAKELKIDDSDFILKVKGEASGVYKALDFGAPTKRKRYFCGDFIKPDLVETNKEFQKLGYILECLGEPLSKDENIIIDPNWDFTMKKGDITDSKYIFEVSEFEWRKAKRLKEDRGYMGRMSFPENLDKPSRTIMATMSCSSRESFILGYKKDKYRLPTVREVATIMSFPLDYMFYGKSKLIKYKLVGNAVPPKLSYAFAKAIAKKEKMNLTKEYKKINHDNKIQFYNLNGRSFPLNDEKDKKSNAKFKYHIPYMIINSYRVELTNKESSFEDNIIKWSIEIHKGQGKNAKIIVPDISSISVESREVDNFICRISNKIITNKSLQEAFCMTDKARIEEKLIGPYELLESVKVFLEDYSLNNYTEGLFRYNEFIIPNKIILGYYILSKIVMNLK